MFWHYVCIVIREVTRWGSMFWNFQCSPRPWSAPVDLRWLSPMFWFCKRDENNKCFPPWKTMVKKQNLFWTSIFSIHVTRNTRKLDRMKKGKENWTTHGFLNVITVMFKNMFRQFFCHPQFWVIQSTKLNLKCITNSWVDKINSRNKTMHAVTRKVLN